MDLEVLFDGRVASVFTVRRWTEHLEILPDHPLITISLNYESDLARAFSAC
jgi:hypothetical protein